METYNRIGFEDFTTIIQNKRELIKEIKIRQPNLSFRMWFQYMKNILTLAPFKRDQEGLLPEGGKKNGGTFVIRGNEVVYQWFDRLPGDYPSIDDVLDAASNKSPSSLTVIKP